MEWAPNRSSGLPQWSVSSPAGRKALRLSFLPSDLLASASHWLQPLGSLALQLPVGLREEKEVNLEGKHKTSELWGTSITSNV